MRLIPEHSPTPRLLALPLALFLVGGLIATRLWPNLIYGLAHCPMRDITGVPCPTCGGTHTATNLAAGRWLEALAANPVVAVALIVFILWAGYCLVATLVPAWRRSLSLTLAEKKAARILAAFLFIGAWVYQIVRVNT